MPALQKGETVMKSVGTLLILIWSLMLMSCVQSLNPLYTEQDLIYDNSLVGVWIDMETGETWAFSNGGKLEYKLLHTEEDGRSGEFSARLVKIEDKTFLDIVPVKTGFPQSDFYQSHFLMTHTFMHVETKESTVQISVLESRWLKDLLAENPEAINHEKINGEIVLSSSPKDMQKFLLANLNTREAFSKPFELTRKKSAR
jgi:hypothetical protein